ncbi:hypothetical protein AHAS_Ahas05G0094300 [Arachis hypogaea]
MAWELELRRVIVESDSQAAIQIIQDAEKTKNHPEPLIRHIYNLIKREWSLKFSYTYREGNRAADSLAKEGRDWNAGFTFLDQPPSRLKLFLDEDGRGTCLPRTVNVR